MPALLGGVRDKITSQAIRIMPLAVVLSSAIATRLCEISLFLFTAPLSEQAIRALAIASPAPAPSPSVIASWR
jgi:hypothetical protein